MEVITHDMIRELDISPEQSIQWVENGFKMKHECQLPPKTSLKLEGNIFYNTMPCIMETINSAGVKVVSRYPKRSPSLESHILLYSTETGSLEAIIDATWITAMRTGAVAALAIKTFAVKNFQTVSLVGLGNTARATFEALLSIYKDKLLKIKLLKYKDQAEDFINRFSKAPNVEFEICENFEELVFNADVILSCVTVAENLFGRDELYKEGVLVVPVHTRGFQNCDLFFDKVYADDKEHVSNFKYFDRFKKFAEFSDVLLGKTEGRADDNERILSYNIGIALHDIYFARQIYDRLMNKGKIINFKTPNDKFWY
ncbi:ornithine cyclodeaminase family protein [Methanosarcina sp. WWM596]|uniref:ornithine cyclodeaminase family protein n=1 Tax=Methanosarcina sp. WWM596 TaxID=1434103 RepID=UPI000615BA09|nr:ornithine cyclodeaminase family protein [Methanosarcina sp. WWM596]AKB17737.1 Ornithine cyclodeaminase [Methanosarcina sp. WWM596]